MIEFPMFDFDGENLYTLTRCMVCNAQLKDPRILPCLHSFCLQCLKDFQGVDQLNTSINSNSSLFFNLFRRSSTLSKNSLTSNHSKKLSSPSSLSSSIISEELSCPVCHREVSIPEGGLDNLKPNLFLEKMLQVKRIADGEEKISKNKKIKCQVCESLKLCGDAVGEETEAVKFCVDCGQHLCPRCVDYHMRLTTTENHRLYKVGCEQELVKRMEDLECSEHPSEKLLLYCKTCKTCICKICFGSPSHSGHSACSVLEVGLKVKESMELDLDELNYDLGTIRKNLREVEEISERFESNMQKIENSILNKEEEMMMVLKRQGDKLKAEVEQKKNSFEREVEKARSELQNHKDKLEHSINYAKAVLKKSSNAVLVSASEDIEKRLKELRKMKVSELTSEIEPTFVPSKVATELVLGRRMSIGGGVGAGAIRNKLAAEQTASAEENLIGVLEFKTKFTRKKLLAESLSKAPVLMQSLTFNDYAIAVTKVSDDEGDLLVLATYSSDELKVKDACVEKNKNKIRFREEFLKVEGLKNPFSLAFVQNFLFISEWKNDVIHRIEVVVELTKNKKESINDIRKEKEDDMRSHVKHSLCTGQGLNALSSSLDGRYLLLTNPDHDSILFLDTEFHKVRKISLDPSIDKPCFTIQLNDDPSCQDLIEQNEGQTSAASAKERHERFVVTHSGGLHDRVCLIDGSGKLLNVCGNLKGGPGGKRNSIYSHQPQLPQKQKHQFNGPYRVCADLNSNLLFVADHYNHRILLLNTISLRVIRELVNPTFGLSYPLDLFFDPNRQLLHIADLDNKRFLSMTFE